MTLNTDPFNSSVGERRGQILPPLQTNFSRPASRPSVFVTRPNRPRPEEYQNDGEAGERVRLHTPVRRQPSKSGLRSIFSWDKPHYRESTDSRLSGIEEAQDSASPIAANPGAPTLATSKTTFSMPTVVTLPSVDLNRPRTSRSRHRTGGDKPAAGEIGWKPPPLFQAYPQALKHDSLLVPSLSADSILRVQATSSAKNFSARDELARTESPAARKKENKEKKKHMRTLSETIGKTEWSPKIYVLVTTGYILQYAGSGKYDRLPEKMLQLGPKSVAFASDAIPGKHWVLQISQTNDENSTSTDMHRHLFSRFGFHRSHAKRLTRSLLLVFNAPEEMNSWLLAVRAQIEARGGKKYVSEKAGDDDTEPELESQPSTRQMVKKDPNRFSQTYLHPQPATDDKESSDQSCRSSYVSFNRRSQATQPTAESRSESISTAHTEMTSPVSGQARFYTGEIKLEVNGAGSPPNGSAISTVLAALDEPPRSPTFSGSKGEPEYPSNTSKIADTANNSPPQPTESDPILRSASPPAPNFSVPSFSKRFTARIGHAQMAQIPRFGSFRGDESPADEVDTISAFPSPPQSISSVAMSESHEQLVAFRDSTQMSPLRISNCEDSPADPTMQNFRFQKAPRPSKSATATSTAFQSSCPPSIIEHAHSQIAPSPPQKHHRVSVFPSVPPNRPTTGPMIRRKSMPGLSVGPPAMPPPDCPLPKIPSPVEPPLPNIAAQFPVPRMCISPSLSKGNRLRRESLTGASRPIHTPPPLATQSLGSRYPRTVSGI
ncbi:hypothetical protein BDV28DRAFT_35271 [Aspergillus coremiiformis]|uniref:Peptidase family M20/M25/M40 protein n=1 Tax=Aspergillus coremiiformis TaxID=138285 RepID=A0A5N6YYX7_9EURO|nr:hypothetical protein BDV28DRAFT_35271 [Aspergillus coremiiformis]